MSLKKLTIVLTATVSLAAASALLAEPDLSKLPKPSDKKDLTFDKDIKPLFEASCAKCHGTERPKGKFSVVTKDAVLKEGENGKNVIAGDSAKSPLVHYIADLEADMEMPPLDKRDKYKALTKDEVALVRAWIDQGAK